MVKTRIFGAVVLAIVGMIGLVGLSAERSWALWLDEATGEILVAEAVPDGFGTDDMDDLAEAVNSAKEALTYVRGRTALYPGMEKYLEKLIAYGEMTEVADEGELVKVIDEAVAAVPLIVPEENEVSVTEVVKSLSSEYVEPAADLAVALQLEVRENVEAAPEETEDKGEKQENPARAEEIEVPTTGEVRKAGFGEFLLAGVIVVLGTVTATLVVLRGKK